jgi:UDP-N-acetylmuramoylalanine--D-glutamate ligase
VTLARGVEPAAVRAGLATFSGVPHRLEEIATVGGVLYVNDSKATNVDAALTGIGAFDSGLHAILGGRSADVDFRPLAAPLRERARAVYLIGEAAPALRAALDGLEPRDCGDLKRAVAAAAAAARPGDVVLLSPACKSFDQYSDFEARGEHFRRLVSALARQESSG